MMCALMVRRLKPGAYDEFRKSWEPQPWWPGLQRVWLARNDEEPDVVATWALLELHKLDEAGVEAMRTDSEWLAEEARRMERVAPYEDELIISGFFRIAEEITPTPSAG